MPLIAFRSEYQISIDSEKNRIFYKPYAASRDAVALPYYLHDWQLALEATKPGFTILTDVTEFITPNSALFETFVAAQQLIVKAGVRAVAEVHQPGSLTLQVSVNAQDRSSLPVHRFADLWTADKFLDGLL